MNRITHGANGVNHNNTSPTPLTQVQSTYLRELVETGKPPSIMPEFGSYDMSVRLIVNSAQADASPQALRRQMETLLPGVSLDEQETDYFPFVEFKDLRNLPKPEWLLYDVIPTKGINYVYGPPGCGKTFFATGVACSIASEIDWIGRATKHGHVIYVAAEDIDDVAQRVLAWASYHNIDDIPNLHFFPCPLDLARDTPKFIQSIEHTYGDIPIVLFVVDTLAMCSLGIDENTKKDFDAVIGSMEQLWRKWNCCVMPLHHSGNDGQMRGTSAMDGSAYSMITVSESDEQTILKSYKARRGKGFDPIHLTRAIVDTGLVDEMGLSITTCVLIQGNCTSSDGSPRLSKLQRNIIQHLRNLGGIDVARTELMQACEIDRQHESGFVNAVSTLVGNKYLDQRKEKQRSFYSLTELATDLEL